jgi:hypothetical protein
MRVIEFAHAALAEDTLSAQSHDLRLLAAYHRDAAAAVLVLDASEAELSPHVLGQRHHHRPQEGKRGIMH